jgi:uncharacterized protein
MSQTPARLPTLDILRGLAVMGILLMNIGAFALPEGAFFNPDAVAVHGRWDRLTWTLQFIFVDGKFRNIFSLLFGAGMLLVLRRAEAAGQDEGNVHMRRMAVLAGFGLAHFYLLWSGDILFHYAVVGAMLLLVTDRSPRRLLAMALVCLLLNAAITAATIRPILAIQADPAAWRDSAATFGALDPAAMRAEIALMRSDYGALFHDRLLEDGILPFIMLPATGFETAALMMIGMAAFKSGFLTGGWPRARYRRIAITGYALGLPPMLGLASWCNGQDFRPLTGFLAVAFWSLPARPLLALAHVALALLWIGDGQGPVRARIAAVGRAAFTNYLGTSLVMSALFAGWGLGLFARLDRLALLGVVAAGWAAMLLWSAPWLARHAHGPLEGLWRRLARPRPESPD